MPKFVQRLIAPHDTALPIPSKNAHAFINRFPLIMVFHDTPNRAFFVILVVSEFDYECSLNRHETRTRDL